MRTRKLINEYVYVVIFKDIVVAINNDESEVLDFLKSFPAKTEIKRYKLKQLKHIDIYWNMSILINAVHKSLGFWIRTHISDASIKKIVERYGND